MKFLKRFFLAVSLVTVFLLSGCESEAEQKVVIWTDCSEFAQYIELFNSTHKNTKAVLVYKDNPALSLPPAEDEPVPDLIVGSWLCSDSTQKYFRPLNYLFDRKLLSSDIFYEQLLDAGRIRHIPYLLPVSFNLPAIIFDKKNSELVTTNYTISPEELRAQASLFNEEKRNGGFSKIGFSPVSSNDFLYAVSKINGVNFREEKEKIVWNAREFESTVNFIRNWVNTENSSVQEELDFTSKYLFMSDIRKVFTDRTLFSYTTSDILFREMKSQNLDLEYRWLADKNVLPVEDSFSMLGIYHDCKNQPGATEFITWFFDSQTQEKIISRKVALRLNTEIFGIAGGFSAVQDITEHILPVYYNQLLSNLPPAELLSVPQKLPARWESYKLMVVEPYLQSAITASEASPRLEFSELENEWRKKVFD